MMSDPVSESLKALLRRDGITREGLAGPVARRGLASAPVSGEEDRKRRHSPTAGGGEIQPMGIRLVVSNRQSVRSSARKPCLMLVWSDGHLITRRPSKAMR